MQLKHQKGKLPLRKPLADIVQEQGAQNGLQLLPIEPPDIYGLGQLPSHHADPFDRLILSQIKRCGFRWLRTTASSPSTACPSCGESGPPWKRVTLAHRLRLTRL